MNRHLSVLKHAIGVATLLAIPLSSAVANENIYHLNIINAMKTDVSDSVTDKWLRFAYKQSQDAIKIINVQARFPTAAIGSQWWMNAAQIIEAPKGKSIRDANSPQRIIYGNMGRSSSFNDNDVNRLYEYTDSDDGYYIEMTNLFQEPVIWKVQYQCQSQGYGQTHSITLNQWQDDDYNGDVSNNILNVLIYGCGSNQFVQSDDEYYLYDSYFKKLGTSDSIRSQLWSGWLDISSTPNSRFENEGITIHTTTGSLACKEPSAVTCYNTSKGNYAYAVDHLKAYYHEDNTDLSCDLYQGLICDSSASGNQYGGTSCWDNWTVQYYCDHVDTAIAEIHKHGYDTGWLDRDDPGSAGNGDHDWEKLEQHSSSGNLIEGLTRVEPAYVEMRRKHDRKDVSDTGDAYGLNTMYGGKVKNYSSNPISGDYEIRFHYGWTPWLSRDRETGSGDHEGHTYWTNWSNSPLGGRMPARTPNKIECRAKSYPNTVFSNESATIDGTWIRGDLGDGKERLFRCDLSYGLQCLNDTNTDKGYASCIDMEARRYFGYDEICNGNVADGTDNGSCDGSK
ncbi:hypothetical protein NI389_05645 [Pseudoalteromonas xiamenensis]|uniref:hypothetical protein n=1 Tax=Pseudoalteromonas xiamenensis TaxID=882626 RepID=UPI0027E4DC98|nr:hypothetical protein [Pseudoalteromonas xiamenensis]WMN60892.1 hypothetical protein NI389_05645 [Pseudoalteromonas xiamenensis]